MRNGWFLDVPHPLEPFFDRLRKMWGWYFALGVVMTVLGAAAAAFAFYTTVASVVVVGSVLILAGLTLGMLSFLIGRWSGFLLSVATAVLSVVTGVMLLRTPVSGAAALTLMIASFLLVSGLFRAIASAVIRFPNWGYSALGGIVAIVLGGMLLAEWPAVALWFLGFYVGIDLMMHGFAWCMFAVSFRNFVNRFVPEERRDRAA